MEPTWGFDGCWKSRLSVQRKTIITNKFVSKIEAWSNSVLYFYKLEFLSEFPSQGFCSLREQETQRRVSRNTVLAAGARSSLVTGPDRSSSSNSCLEAEEWLKRISRFLDWKDKYKEVTGSAGSKTETQTGPKSHSGAKAGSCLFHVLCICPEGGTILSKTAESHLSKHFHQNETDHLYDSGYCLVSKQAVQFLVSSLTHAVCAACQGEPLTRAGPMNHGEGHFGVGQEALEEGMVTHFSILAWRIPTDRGSWWATAHGVAKSQTWLSD